ncbi:MAG: ATP-dependent Clp protease proteolytic subunit [Phycisphaerae bacterium]|nr:ATP-dependent Clp protease proteolytic subunit [Phycisphaerae bacterium]
MGSMDLFWVFFMLAAVQPVIRKKLLESARQRLLMAIEKERGSRVIVLIHRQETMSLIGFPLFRYIDINDSEEILRAIQMTDPDVPIDLILHTPGGLVLASLQIARAIAQRKAKTTVFVPHYAMSGGTLIALAASEIVMCHHAVLGPVDPQIGPHAAASLLKVLEQKPMKDIDDETIMLADQARKAVDQLRQAVRELLGDRMPAEKAEQLSETLTSGRWTHDYPITCKEAQELGLAVRCDVPEKILRLIQLYPQPLRRDRSVEYNPLPRRSERLPQR